MKLNNLAVHAKHTTLVAFIAMMANACMSPKERLNEVDKEIASLEAQIDSAYIKNEVTDSVARNPMLQAMQTVIDKDANRIDSLRIRNIILSDSIQEQKEKKAANQYPLTMFLSKSDLRQLKEQLLDFHNAYNNKYAENIIAGTGTLHDLYKISFDLDYSSFEPPFHIINEFGYVRFDNPRLNKYCRQFEASLESFEQEDIARKIKLKENKIEFDSNEYEVNQFERFCEIRDSIYMQIEAHFAPKIQHRIDSLTARRNALLSKRNELFSRMNQK